MMESWKESHARYTVYIVPGRNLSGGNVVKAQVDEPESIGRELPTTHRVAIYARWLLPAAALLPLPLPALLREQTHYDCHGIPRVCPSSRSFFAILLPIQLPTRPRPVPQLLHCDGDNDDDDAFYPSVSPDFSHFHLMSTCPRLPQEEVNC